jgi:hypothetical protein
MEIKGSKPGSVPKHLAASSSQRTRMRPAGFHVVIPVVGLAAALPFHGASGSVASANDDLAELTPAPTFDVA